MARIISFVLVLLVVACAPRAREGMRSKPVVFIDAGHGGRDSGARVGALEEKSIVLETALHLQTFLIKRGYAVYMSRFDDRFVPLQKRVSMSKKATIFVSLHVNSAKNRAARGPEVFYFDNARFPYRSAESFRLASMVIDRLVSSLSSPSRGVKKGDFCVIREPQIPSVLIELAFMTNLRDAAFLSSKRYRRLMGEAIGRGIEDYFEGSEKRPRHGLNVRPVA